MLSVTPMSATAEPNTVRCQTRRIEFGSSPPRTKGRQPLHVTVSLQFKGTHTHTHTRSLRTCPEKVAAALINRIQCSSNFLINQAQCSAVGRSLRSFRRRESLFSPFTTSAEFALNMFSTVAKTFKPRETEDLSCRDVLKGS